MKVCSKVLALSLAASTSAFPALAKNFRLDFTEPEIFAVSAGQAGTRAEVCYTTGTLKTIGVNVGGDLLFWLPLGDCAIVRNDSDVGVSLSGNPKDDDTARGSINRMTNF